MQIIFRIFGHSSAGEIPVLSLHREEEEEEFIRIIISSADTIEAQRAQCIYRPEVKVHVLHTASEVNRTIWSGALLAISRDVAAFLPLAGSNYLVGISISQIHFCLWRV